MPNAEGLIKKYLPSLDGRGKGRVKTSPPPNLPHLSQRTDPSFGGKGEEVH